MKTLKTNPILFLTILLFLILIIVMIATNSTATANKSDDGTVTISMDTVTPKVQDNYIVINANGASYEYESYKRVDNPQTDEDWGITEGYELYINNYQNEESLTSVNNLTEGLTYICIKPVTVNQNPSGTTPLEVLASKYENMNCATVSNIDDIKEGRIMGLDY